MITVVLADDHPLVRRGLRAVLEAEEDIEVLAEAGDGLDALAQVERHRPHVLVIDLAMPRMTGVEAARRAGELPAPPRVVMLSMHADEPYVLDALRAGALAYVLKDSGADELVRAVRSAARGERYLSATLTQRALDAYAERGRQEGDAPHEALTAREREVLLLVAQGLSNGEIAARLHLGATTVKTHVGRILDKLELRDRVQAVVLAYESALVRPGLSA